MRGQAHVTAHSDLRPRGVIVHAFSEEVTTLGPNALMTQQTRPFDLSFNLWSPSAHNDKLPKGEYDFPIEFALPAGLPPTFRGEFTRIVYLIEAKVDLPLLPDIRHEEELRVLPAPLIAADTPVRTSASLSPALKIELELSASGFYPGDHIHGTLRFSGAAAIASAWVELVSQEKAEAREFADHAERVRVRAEIDPVQLSGGQPFPIDLPVPEDADPSFVGQYSSKARLVRARVTLADNQLLMTEAVVQVGVR